MQHVLIIPSWYPSYAQDVRGSFFKEQALALKEAGFKVGIITPALRSIHHRKSFVGKWGAELCIENSIPVFRQHGLKIFPYSQVLNLKYWELLGLQLFKEYVKKYGIPDLLHVNSMIYGVAWAKAIFHKYGIPYIITEHSSEFVLGNVKPYLQSYLADAIAKASRRIAVSSSLAETLHNKFIGVGDKYEWNVIPNMVDDRFFVSDSNLKSDVFVFSNVAGLVRNKGHNELIRAFATSFHDVKDTVLKIYGEGPERIALEKLIIELNLVGKVYLEGEISREQMPTVLAASNIFVLSSKYETFNIAIVEALAMGLPVISTACGGPQDIVRVGNDGILVPVDDINAMAQAMHKMKVDSHAFNSIQISNSCKHRFSSDTYVRNYTRIYSKINES